MFTQRLKLGGLYLYMIRHCFRFYCLPETKNIRVSTLGYRPTTVCHWGDTARFPVGGPVFIYSQSGGYSFRSPGVKW